MIFEGDYPPKDKLYNNVVAYSVSDGTMLWRVEVDEKLDYRNFYEGVVDNGQFLIFFKIQGHKIAVDRYTGQILKNIDLMSGRRPW